MSPSRRSSHLHIVSMAVGLVGSTVTTVGLTPSAVAMTGRQSGVAGSTAAECDPLDLLGQQSTADGGMDYQFQLPSGSLVDTLEPPAGFDPATATAGELSLYGLPPRPTSATALDAWSALMATYTPTGPTPPQLCALSNGDTSSSFRASRSLRLTPRIRYSSTTPQPSTWSGYVSETSPKEMVEAWGSYDQPTISNYCGYASSEESTWVGIGGADPMLGVTGTENGLIQAGTAYFQEVPYGASHLNGYYPWYEYLDNSNMNPNVVNTSAPLHAGDAVHVYIAYAASSSTAEMDVWVSGTEPISFLSKISSEYYDGRTAEWIDEGDFGDWTDFGSTTWTDAYVVDAQGITKNLGTTDYNAFEGGRFTGPPAQQKFHLDAQPDQCLNSSGDGFTDHFLYC